MFDNKGKLLDSTKFAIFVILQVFSCSFLRAQDINVKDFVNVYSKEYISGAPQKIDKSNSRNHPLTKAFYNDGIDSVNIIQFSSKANISKNTKIRFRIIIYSFHDSESLKKKLLELNTSNEEFTESIFQKDWDFLTTQKNQILRLDAGCLLSESKWKGIKKKFMTITKSSYTNMECFCGRGCQFYK